MVASTNAFRQSNTESMLPSASAFAVCAASSASMFNATHLARVVADTLFLAQRFQFFPHGLFLLGAFDFGKFLLSKLVPLPLVFSGLTVCETVKPSAFQSRR